MADSEESDISKKKCTKLNKLITDKYIKDEAEKALNMNIPVVMKQMVGIFMDTPFRYGGKGGEKLEKEEDEKDWAQHKFEFGAKTTKGVKCYLLNMAKRTRPNSDHVCIQFRGIHKDTKKVMIMSHWGGGLLSIRRGNADGALARRWTLPYGLPPLAEEG